MMYWIYDYPSWAIALLFCGVSVGFTWIDIFLMHRTVHSWIHREKSANEMVSVALASFFTLFGLLLGLLAIATYQNYSNVGDVVDREASSLGALYYDFARYPQPIRGQLQDELREYTRYTIEEGWEQQRHGIVPTGGNKRMALMAQTLYSFEPNKKSEEIIHAATLQEFNHKSEIGRQRLSNVTTGLPAVLWWVVVFVAVMGIGLISMQDMQIHVHMLLGGVLASILGALIFLVAELDNPFRGDVSIGPASITRVYKTVMKPDESGAAKGEQSGARTVDAPQEDSPSNATK